jgi:hypothetical protein
MNNQSVPTFAGEPTSQQVKAVLSDIDSNVGQQINQLSPSDRHQLEIQMQGWVDRFRRYNQSQMQEKERTMGAGGQSLR